MPNLLTSRADCSQLGNVPSGPRTTARPMVELSKPRLDLSCAVCRNDGVYQSLVARVNKPRRVGLWVKRPSTMESQSMQWP